MKRRVIIISFFALLAALCLTGCTCNCDGEECHGCGYECLDCFDEPVSASELAIEGEHYSKPEIQFTPDKDSAKFSMSMDIYKDLNLNLEICFVQDGIVLDKYTFTHPCTKDQKISVEKEYQFSSYNPEGGQIYYILNKFEASRKAN